MSEKNIPKEGETQSTVILEPSLPLFILKIDEHRREGWEFIPDVPPATWGFSYECHLQRFRSAEELVADAKAVADALKPTREEILVKAREAKALKRVQEALEGAQAGVGAPTSNKSLLEPSEALPEPLDNPSNPQSATFTTDLPNSEENS
jgi:hypothetical protein